MARIAVRVALSVLLAVGAVCVAIVFAVGGVVICRSAPDVVGFAPRVGLLLVVSVGILAWYFYALAARGR